MILLLDNRDSFTFNLARLVEETGRTCQVQDARKADLAAIAADPPDALILSPGPGGPQDSGVCMAACTDLAPQLPVLGVCLGMQAMVAAFGGHVGPARRLVHGETSWVDHSGKGIFEGLPRPFSCARYHSLACSQDGLPEVLEVVARTAEDGELMAVHHRSRPLWGVQFHPESYLTPHGRRLLAAFLESP